MMEALDNTRALNLDFRPPLSVPDFAPVKNLVLGRFLPHFDLKTLVAIEASANSYTSATSIPKTIYHTRYTPSPTLTMSRQHP